MSTEFIIVELAGENFENADDAVGFVRWGRGGRRGVGYEFGTITNWEHCRMAADMGMEFRPIDGQYLRGDGENLTPAWFDEIVADGSATFGEFGITVAWGSDTHWRFIEEH